MTSSSDDLFRHVLISISLLKFMPEAEFRICKDLFLDAAWLRQANLGGQTMLAARASNF